MQQMNKHWRALELDKVLEMLAAETACDDAAQLARELRPAETLRQTERLLQETDDAYVLMAKFGAPSFGGLKNIANALRRAEAGGTLNLPEFLRIAEVLRCLRGISEWRSKSEGMKTTLDWRFESIQPNKYLEDRIRTIVASEEEVADGASQTLAAIRRKIRHTSSRARELLDKMIRSPSYLKYLQEPIVTMRGGRFVVPVKAECRGDVPGLVHDTSSSGATVFIEPMSVVEANNEIRVLLSQEQAEIDRILTELSAEAGSFADGIINSCGAAVELSLIFAKANLAYKMKAVKPVLNEDGKIELHRARHPLIDKNKVVPTDIELGIHFDTLVITGPNTGGKTVSLKTLGLLTLMAMCGLMIPAAEGSKISLFHEVLADIGDEQSIEQSLSTFSAHMTNIIKVLDQAGESSLVLIDELGAGTDPVEGAALAVAILEALRQKGARIAATTHYAELKAYALQTKGVENGSCEFDVATLRPTYRLLIGVPGRSNAFAISTRLGMSDEIVSRAKELVSSENARFEDVVQSLETSRQSLETAREQAEKQRVEASRIQKEAEEIRRRAQDDAEKEIAKAREQASQLVARTRAQIDALLNEIEELRRQKNKALSAEQKARLKSGMRSLEDTADPVRKRQDVPYELPRPLKMGDPVLIADIEKEGTVVDVGDNKALIQAGIIKTWVPFQNLRLLDEKNQPKPQPQRRITRTASTRQSASMELDLRGQDSVEAIMNVDHFLDHAQMAGLHVVSIIHGKGTGVLRKAVQDHLRRHPAVKSFRLGTYGEGESGVTIAELK